MHLLTEHRGRKVRRLGLLVAITVAALAITGSASAIPYRAIAWGDGVFGQLGTGNQASTNTPVGAGMTVGVAGVAAGGQGGSLALLTDGTVLEWGNGVLAPMTVAGLSGVTAVASGGGERLAVLGSGEVMTWGGSEGLVPVGVGEATAVASGPDGGFGLAVLKDGTVKAWGRNNYGQLGDGVTNEGSSEPLAVCAVGTEGACPEGPYLSGVVAIAAGEYHSLALLGNGTVVAWGLGFHGQLGNGPGSPSFGDPTPTPVGGVSGVTAIAASGEHSMALEADGTVTEWGACCAKGYPYLPATVAGLSEVTSIAAGRGHSLALLSNGAVMAWGVNQQGQLGDGNHKSSSTPVAVSELPRLVTRVVGIAAGDYHSLAFGPAPAPTLMKLSPLTGSAAGGTPVAITGTNLLGATAVKFGATDATSFTVNSEGSISAIVPEHTLGLVDITVTTPSGTSAITSRDRFKFTPTVTSVSPNTGPTSGGTSVTVTGTGFALGTTATKVKFGTTTSKSVNCTSTTECTVMTPAHKAGTVDVKATVSKLSSPTNPPADEFTYN